MRQSHFDLLRKNRYYIAFSIAAACAILSILFVVIICHIVGTNVQFNLPFFLLTGFFLASYTAVFMHIVCFAAQRISRQEQLIAEHEKQLVEAEKEKMRANLLRAVSHDLRTPLTGIIGSCLAYRENGAFLKEDEKEELVENIYNDSTWLLHMVENLLTVTRIKDEDLSITTSQESLEEVVEESLQKMKRRYPSFEIRASIPDDFILIPMDAILIEQVTINLLENAYLHSGTTKPVDLIVENYPSYVSFTIRDYGLGIPEQKFLHLFDGADYTADTTDAKKGMGIGLIICKTIIAAHHGTLIARNHSEGAEFIFTLPKKKEGTHEC